MAVSSSAQGVKVRAHLQAGKPTGSHLCTATTGRHTSKTRSSLVLAPPPLMLMLRKMAIPILMRSWNPLLNPMRGSRAGYESEYRAMVRPAATWRVLRIESGSLYVAQPAQSVRRTPYMRMKVHTKVTRQANMKYGIEEDGRGGGGKGRWLAGNRGGGLCKRVDMRRGLPLCFSFSFYSLFTMTLMDDTTRRTRNSTSGTTLRPSRFGADVPASRSVCVSKGHRGSNVKIRARIGVHLLNYPAD